MILFGFIFHGLCPDEEVEGRMANAAAQSRTKKRPRPDLPNTEVAGRMAGEAMMAWTPWLAIGSWTTTGIDKTCAPVLAAC